MHTRGCTQILHYVQNDKGKGKSSDELMRACPNNDKKRRSLKKKKNKNPRNQRYLRMKNETPTKNYQLSIINYYNHGKHKQNTLEQNPEHRHHRADRHCHHLRRNLVHGSVKKEEAKNCLFLVLNPNFFFTFVTYKEKHSL